MEYSFGYAKTKINLNIKVKNFMDTLIPNKVTTDLKGKDEVNRSLNNPIGSKKLKYIVNNGEKIVIITSDITRPMPSKIVLPLVIDEITKGGVKDKDITIVFAVGSHRSHTEEEKRYISGNNIYDRIKCIDSNSMKYLHLGNTKAGTPIDICEAVAKADRRICLGNIEYHYFAGYSGGAKAIMPGVSTYSAIQSNHRLMVKEASKAGNLDTNPVRLDIEEVEEYVPIDFILNVVLNEKKEIIKAVSGNHVKAHREGCKFLDSFYKIKIKEKADIVITTPGGYPKDLNLYQAQKSIDNAKHAVKRGGIMILAAACNERLGGKVFEEWMTGFEKSGDMITEIKKNFQLGGHKAAAIAMVLENCRIFLVSEMEPDFVKSIFMEPFPDIQSAINKAIEELGEDSKVLLMPYGGSTLPIVS